MNIFSRFFGRDPKGDSPDLPFMEHPTGEFNTALQAIRSAMERLDTIDMRDRWISFCGQGQGTGVESTFIVDVPYTHQRFDVGTTDIDLPHLLRVTGLNRTELQIKRNEEGMIEIADADPAQRARFLDALFQHLGVKPFEDEEDYAVGAEWV